MLGQGGRLAIGRREHGLGPRCFDDDRVSRVHAAIQVDDNGRLQLRDSDSRNGTHLNGHRIKAAELSEGDVVGVGGSLIVVGRARADWAARTDPHITGVGPAHTALVEAVDGVTRQSAPVLVVGETGTGKDFIVQQLHHRTRPDGPLVTVHCGAIAEQEIHRQLFGPEGRVGASHGGTFYLDGIEDASERLQAALLSFLESRSFLRLGDDAQTQVDTRIVASSRVDPDHAIRTGALREAFAARLSHWVLRLPTLHQRREDIALLAHAFARQFTGEATPLHPKLVLSLLRARWRGNLHGLRSEVERAIVESGGERPVRRPRAAVDSHREPPSSSHDGDSPVASSRSAAATVEIGPHGRWFCCEGGEPVQLGHRPSLARVLAGLVRCHQDQPERVLAAAELVALGWPDERVSAKAGINRVYVAVSTLRKLGLRDAIHRTRSGYRLDPETQFRVQE